MTSANVPRVTTALQRSPNQSRLGQEAGCCRATVNRIARVKLWALTQNVFIHQILTESYKTARQQIQIQIQIRVLRLRPHRCEAFQSPCHRYHRTVKWGQRTQTTHTHTQHNAHTQLNHPEDTLFSLSVASEHVRQIGFKTRHADGVLHGCRQTVKQFGAPVD